jgi:WXG100 family type VII secretion target
MTDFRVDVEELDGVVAELTAAQAALRELADDVSVEVAALRADWIGLASDSHDVAHVVWSAEFASMHDALVAMRAAARHAHTVYSGAAHANRSLWEQVR